MTEGMVFPGDKINPDVKGIMGLALVGDKQIQCHKTEKRGRWRTGDSRGDMGPLFRFNFSYWQKYWAGY